MINYLYSQKCQKRAYFATDHKKIEPNEPKISSVLLDYRQEPNEWTNKNKNRGKRNRTVQELIRNAHWD